MSKRDVNLYSDFSNVEKQENYLTAEEFPDGPFGSPFNKDKPVQLKSTPWKQGQRRYSNFNYENKSLHEGLPREMPGAHPPHDDPNTDEQNQYSK
ncbi:hypothetical protein [Neobacillus dielmonensis]|uniref:hypothetical protein n=1 Tax=Neobacillus dielmonensis TaxID=1347369 RepID=UPI0005A5FD13|nr:hypothetical protein [Neobacillus dielmonensis]